MLKENFTLYIILFFILLFSGCRLYSWIVFENPEFPDNYLPTDLSPKLLEKYTVADVVVHPRIQSTDGTQTNQGIFVVFFSKTDTSVATIKALKLFVNGAELEYGEKIIGVSASAWKQIPENKPYYSCIIVGDPIKFEWKKTEIAKCKVDLHLTILVKDIAGNNVTKMIQCSFIPKKRSYFE